MLSTHAELSHDGRYHAVVRRNGRLVWESIGTYSHVMAECYAERLADAMAGDPLSRLRHRNNS